MTTLESHQARGRDEISEKNVQRQDLQIQVRGPVRPELAEILSIPALQFVQKLEKRFGASRRSLLEKRCLFQDQMDAGIFPNFLKETREIRESDWTVASIPKDLLDRRVEITGPVERKMIINALNSGAKVFMADFEDSHSPEWTSTLQGQKNLYEAVRRTIEYIHPEGKKYFLNPNPAVLFVRPRGWHLVEKHVWLDDQPISASLFDFGLFFFHNAHELIKRGSGPYFYLPKMESHLEARLWNDVFLFAQKELGIPAGTVRATVLIETFPAVFEMDEILYELKDHSSGLNCGRWDYIFSFIKKFRKHPEFTLPDRARVTMDVPFLKSYSQLLIQTCHRRGIHAMGGMAAQIPIKGDAAANAIAMDRVRQDKNREVSLGHDGTWVAHPGLVKIAQETFDSKMSDLNQIGGPGGGHQKESTQVSSELRISAADLMSVPSGEITDVGLRMNINVGLFYLESWLRGVGCVPLYHLMEDAATAEISRAQIWQWITHGKVKSHDFHRVLEEEKKQIRQSVGDEKYESGRFHLAEEILTDLVTRHDFVEFFTLPAYSFL